MPERVIRNRELTAQEAACIREARAEFSTHPSQAELIESGEYAGPMSIEEYLTWRKGAGDLPLARQLPENLTCRVRCSCRRQTADGRIPTLWRA
jgi:hypothetical protein